MTREEATEIAKRIAKSWRGGPAFAEWCGYLVGYDDQALANSALDRLREIEPLSFKAFGDKYRQLARLAEPLAVSNVVEMPARRLSRPEVQALLIANGAPARIVSRTVLEGPT